MPSRRLRVRSKYKPERRARDHSAKQQTPNAEQTKTGVPPGNFREMFGCRFGLCARGKFESAASVEPPYKLVSLCRVFKACKLGDRQQGEARSEASSVIGTTGDTRSEACTDLGVAFGTD